MTSSRLPLLALALAATAALLAAAAFWRLLDNAPAPPATDGYLLAQLADLRERIQRLEAGPSFVVPATGGDSSARTEVVDWSRIEAMVAAALARHSTTATSANAAATDAGSWLERLQASTGGAAGEELWAEIRAANALDAVVAEIEQRAAAYPNSPEAQTLLGVAYIEQMLATPDEATRIALGQKIDAAFAKALEADPEHWEARFRRAVGQSHAPPLSGVRQDAIANFERLVAQQMGLQPAAGQERTYLYLGRLYAEQGNRERAAALWRQGLARHPNDRELQRLVENLPR